MMNPSQNNPLLAQLRATRAMIPAIIVVAGVAFAASCSRESPPRATVASPASNAAPAIVLRDTVIADVLTASGIAAPVQTATVSTKLMGSITEVLVKEGDVVAAGQPLVRIDARDLTAKQAQVAASVSEADAVQRDASTQAARIRALYVDSAATKAQLDAVETGLARATAGLASARAAESELRAVASYAVVSAPFAGVITKRFVDPGAFAAPGGPLVTIQDDSRIRISVATTPEAAARLHRGARIAGRIEGQPVTGTIEGVVPSGAALYMVNAIVSNANRALLAGGSAAIDIPAGSHRGVLVPATAIRREGDLTGVMLRSSEGDGIRWVRLGRSFGDLIEITSGVRAGDRVVIPSAAAPVASAGSN